MTDFIIPAPRPLAPYVPPTTTLEIDTEEDPNTGNMLVYGIDAANLRSLELVVVGESQVTLYLRGTNGEVAQVEIRPRHPHRLQVLLTTNG